MWFLVVAIIIGSGIAYFSAQNTQPVSIYIGGYEVYTYIPLYVVIIVSLVAGILIAWLISLLGTISSKITIHGKEHTIREDNKRIAELTKKVHQLELENARLKKQEGKEEVDEDSL